MMDKLIKHNGFYVFFLALLLSVNSLVTAEEVSSYQNRKIYLFNIKEEIAPPVWRTTKKAINEAIDIGASSILIDMNTYGGMVLSADSIRTLILNTKIPIYVYINNNAASAGALISVACDSIYMKPGANIGAAAVVNQSGEQMSEKYQSYMSSMMRSTAESNGRDPFIAQAMVDGSVEINNIIKEGKILTFTSKEAMKNGFCEGEFNNIESLINYLGYDVNDVVKQELSTLDRIIGFLVKPYVSSLLIMMIIGGIYFELQSPGIGFAFAVAVLGAIFYFAPLYLEGLAANWEVLLFIIGIILISLEIFVIPGFGVAGISGIVLVVAGLSLSMIDSFHLSSNTYYLNRLTKSIFIVIISSTIAIIGSIYFSKKLLDSSRFGFIALKTTQDKASGYTSSRPTYVNAIGKIGVATTVLRPSGKIEIEGDLFDAYSDSGFIDKGSEVKVLQHNNAQLIVRKIITNKIV